MESLLLEIEAYVIHELNENLDTKFLYHNIAHTQSVVEKTQELIEEGGVEEEDAEDLLIAAWFHDIGYIKAIENHEDFSVEIAKEYLKSKKISSERIEKISKLILATKMNLYPKTELEKLIRDADCSHIGSKEFIEYSELLRQEWELTQDKFLTDSEWITENISFLTTQHRFYSDIASKKWDRVKGKNLVQLLKQQKKINQNTSKIKQKKEEFTLKKNKVELPERGIETMFRVAMRNHITLSDIADTKANILLSVNAIIVSVALSNLLPKLDNPSNHYLIIPSLIFIGFTVVSIILSVLSTRPNVTQGKFTKEDVANKKVNLLFFGNFHQMKLSDFEWGMGEMMKDRDYLYGSLTKDLYFLGLVLNRKYKLLRITYTVFAIGIVVSVIAFALAFKAQEVTA